MSMRAFLKSLDDLDDEGTVALHSATGDQAIGMVLGLRLRRTERSRLRHWRVSCHSVLEHSLVLGSAWGELVLCAEHPRLWPHQCGGWHLFFRGPAPDVPRVIGGLYQAHREVAQHWFSFDQFFNPLLRLPELLGTTGGKLATGPRPVLAAYAQLLEREGISNSLFHTSHPQYSKEAPQVLLLGKSYVIARRFTAEPCEAAPSPQPAS